MLHAVSYVLFLVAVVMVMYLKFHMYMYCVHIMFVSCASLHVLQNFGISMIIEAVGHQICNSASLT